MGVDAAGLLKVQLILARERGAVEVEGARGGRKESQRVDVGASNALSFDRVVDDALRDAEGHCITLISLRGWPIRPIGPVLHCPFVEAIAV